VARARRQEVPVVGLGLPGHFVVRSEPPGGPNQLIHVFEGGKAMSEKDAIRKVEDLTGEAPDASAFEAVSKKAIINRLLHNLLGAAQREKDRDGVLRYLDAIVAIEPDAHAERWVRAVFRFQAGLRDGARADCDYLL